MTTRTAVVVGNPKPGSRTLAAAIRVSRQLTGAEPDVVVDLAKLGGALLDGDDERVAGLVREVSEADLAVVASPTYKGTYTGLLKVFLDRFAPAYGTGLRGVAVPVMLGAARDHALAPELHLRPVLTEIGGTVVTPGLYVIDADHDDPAAYAAWLDRARPAVAAVLGARRERAERSQEGAAVPR
jgi:FMN reductase